jgi:hypothetical protein
MKLVFNEGGLKQYQCPCCCTMTSVEGKGKARKVVTS